jgi:hypothetical protein
MTYKPNADPRLSRFNDAMAGETIIDSNESFNGFCRRAIRVWNESVQWVTTEKLFPMLLRRIGEGGAMNIATAWGGVAITERNDPHVEKYLVVRKGCYLAYEKHSNKEETIRVDEGVGLLIYRAADNSLNHRVMLPGDGAAFAPGQEHCLVALENLLAFEISEEPLGMDKDLIFIFTSIPQ